MNDMGMEKIETPFGNSKLLKTTDHKLLADPSYWEEKKIISHLSIVS